MDVDYSNVTAEVIAAYRNIATCSPSHDLYDDIVADPDDYAILDELVGTAAEIDFSKPQKNRFQQYGNIGTSDICFKASFWRKNRFSDGTFGVWYGASDEKTSKTETLGHRPELDPNDLLNARSPIIQCRRMFMAELNVSRALDLRPYIPTIPDILHLDDYRVCQAIAVHAVKAKVQAILTESIRNEGGMSYPVFDPSVINDRVLYDYFNIFPLDGSKPKTAKIEDT